MATIYKILFDVKLFHEFYLTEPNGNTIFNIVSQVDRLNFLMDQFEEPRGEKLIEPEHFGKESNCPDRGNRSVAKIE